MSDRERNYHKTYIDYINNQTRDDVDIIVFDIEEPYIFYMIVEDISPRDHRRWECYDNTENKKFSARMNIQKGIVRSVEFENDNKKVRALNIARHYRPGIGRSDSALYASLILNFYNTPIESSPLKNLRLPKIINESDNLIKDEILAAFFERHYTGTTNHDRPRFITIPYSTKIKTGPLSYISVGHFVTLIVDLDYRDNGGNFKPFVYVYDSSHVLCNKYGVGSSTLNKDVYFRFGDNILVDNKVLNDDRRCCCCVRSNLASKIQGCADYRCGYYCEAAIDLLLENATFIDNNGGNIIYGIETRVFLQEILFDENVIHKIDNEIIPPNPREWFST